MMYRRARNNSCVVYGCMEQEEHTAIKKIDQSWEALDRLGSLGSLGSFSRAKDWRLQGSVSSLNLKLFFDKERLDFYNDTICSVHCCCQ